MGVHMIRKEGNPMPAVPDGPLLIPWALPTVTAHATAATSSSAAS
jgi:hypothetical protein